MHDDFEHQYKQRSLALLTAMLGSELATEWWNSPNKAFDMRTPADQWLIDYKSVYQYLMKSSEGEW
jgi:hypothetical protein